MILKLGVLLMLLKHFNCAEWINITDVSEVEENGIIAGTNHGQNVFVGMAFSSENYAEPGALYLNFGQSRAPVVVYGNAGHPCNETVGIQYLNKKNSCRYVWVPSSEGQVVKKAVEVYQKTSLMYVGRLEIHGGMQVGKVAVVPHPCNSFYYVHEDVEYSSHVYEVLTCR